MVLTEPLTISIFGSLLKGLFFLILSANSRQKKWLASDELLENRGLYKIARHRK